MNFVVVRPPEGLATAAVYGACRPAEQPRHAAPLVEALRRGDARQAGRLLFNRLQAGRGKHCRRGSARLKAGVCKRGLAWDTE